MLIYLADLYHDYLPTRQHIPLGIGYISGYLHSKFSGDLEIKLFKSVDKLLDDIDACAPDIVGLSNYTWNEGLNDFAGNQIKGIANKDIPIVMGGPNIRIDESGIKAFLENHSYVDRCILFAGEKPMVEITGNIIGLPPGERRGSGLRRLPLEKSYSLVDGELKGGVGIDDDKELDFVPSPYLSGAMDDFLSDGFLPIVETNRGCPFLCTFCVWGVSALSKLKQFSMERVRAELDYLAASGHIFSEIVFADANFGILKRDVEISQHIRDIQNANKFFHAVNIYWSKNVQPHMIDIGRILGKLTNTYVAFQSLDPTVLHAIRRDNISTEKLIELISELREYTHSTQTDLLVGLPNEDFDSHIRSLEEALRYGINHIMGGEIRMLPGSEMDSESSREQYKLNTKYRLCEGQYGYYRNNLVCEFEEVIRETSTMAESEMLTLRVLCTLFFASVTLGEHRPLIAYLVKSDFPIVEFFKKLVEPNSDYSAFDRSLEWCVARAKSEWFGSLKEAKEYFNIHENIEVLFGEKAFLKLNYGMYARLICFPEEYDDFCKKVEAILLELVPDENPVILKEIVGLCRERNLVSRILCGEYKNDIDVKLSEKTITALRQCGYLPPTQGLASSRFWFLKIDSLTEELMSEKISGFKDGQSILQVSQLLEQFRGRSFLELSS